MPPMSQTPPLLMVSQKTPMHNPLSPPPVPMLPSMDVLSVSSKKLCSYCNHELGSGAAMIIENLGLFYHIGCFKCSVCQTPISDGNIHGTDVRVRNSRLHCHNCFSNEEGVKFSCVWLMNHLFPPSLCFFYVVRWKLTMMMMISRMWKCVFLRIQRMAEKSLFRFFPSPHHEALILLYFLCEIFLEIM